MTRCELMELRLATELLEVKVAYLESGRTVGPAEAVAWARAYSVRWRRRFTLSRVCRVWGLARPTVYRHLRSRPKGICRSQWTDGELVSRLRELIDQSPFPAERYRKLWARLRLQGIHVNKERVRLLIKRHELLPPYGSILAERPNQLWGIDSAKVRTSYDGVAFVLFAVDHCTGECMALDVVGEETSRAWLALVKDAVHFGFGSCAPGVAAGLRIRHDNLPIYRGNAFLRGIAQWGVRVSPSPPLSPKSNGLAERFVRTLRDNRLAIRFFASVGELRSELQAFRIAYNNEYLLQRWGYRTPAEIRVKFNAA